MRNGLSLGDRGIGVEVKTKSFFDIDASRAQVTWYRTVYGRGNFIYVFVDMGRGDVGQSFLSYLKSEGGTAYFV